MAIQSQRHLVEGGRPSTYLNSRHSLGELYQGNFLCEESSEENCERHGSLMSFSSPFLSRFGVFPPQMLRLFSLHHIIFAFLFL